MNSRLAQLPAHDASVRDSREVQAALALVNRVSTELSDSYRRLELKVEELSSELEQVDRARLRELEAKEQVSERLQSLLDVLPAAVVVIDRHGVVCQCNPAAATLLEIDARGERWVEVIRRCFSPRNDDGHEISLRNGRRVSVATRSLEKDTGQVVMLTDLTETRELQERLSRHQRLTAMGRMMAALAHQIRTPLSAAMLYASNLCSGELSREQTRKFSQKILARLTHMEQQVRDMLIFVRGDVKLEHCISVAELAAALGSATDSLLATSGGNCRLDMSCSRHLLLRCNREILVGAVMNLVSNALQACGDRATVTLEITTHGERLVICVRDDGPGMSEAVLRQIEDGFFTTKSQGTGLGISVARAVARAHGGELQLISEPGKGTSASIELPLAPAGASAGEHVNAR